MTLPIFGADAQWENQ